MDLEECRLEEGEFAERGRCLKWGIETGVSVAISMKWTLTRETSIS